MNLEECYRVIGRTAAAAAPSGWTRLWIIAELESDNGQCSFDYESATQSRRWFEPATADQYTVYKAFQLIRAEMLAAKQPPWRVATLSLERSGNFHLHFDYEPA